MGWLKDKIEEYKKMDPMYQLAWDLVEEYDFTEADLQKYCKEEGIEDVHKITLMNHIRDLRLGIRKER